jgi:hypothetical protein
MKHSELVIELICRSFVDSIVYQTMVMKFNINSHTASSTVLLVVVSYCLVKRNIINLMHAPGEDVSP